MSNRFVTSSNALMWKEGLITSSSVLIWKKGLGRLNGGKRGGPFIPTIVKERSASVVEYAHW